MNSSPSSCTNFNWPPTRPRSSSNGAPAIRRAEDFRQIAALHARLEAAAPEPALAPPRLAPGEMLGDFRIKRYVTEGGMGEIYEAEQLTLERRRVALKVIRRGKTSPEMRDRFMREQKVLAKLHQTNIVPVFAAGERDELQYFAMQYIDGATLGHVVKWLRTRHVTPGSSKTPSLAHLVQSVSGSQSDPTAATASSSPPVTETSEPPGTPELTDEYLALGRGNLGQRCRRPGRGPQTATCCTAT